MNTKRIDLAEKDHHKENDKLAPELSITVNGQKLTADKTKNEIRQQFDVLIKTMLLMMAISDHRWC
ncbi:hypothetical protein [Pseudidiomarina indica]|uniref:hypothetical protein n=1 Tax=Pseudidiomarina indica TaxID=1159017 RepID=UPI000B17980A|nr:hypothetical protein [Pseudidiomarina indica]